MGGFCSALGVFPNATVGGYGEVRGEHAIMAEVFARGPVAAGVDATILDEYQGGIITDTPEYEINHIVSIVGWGETEDGLKYWVVRNSWGHYWGEMILPHRSRRQGDRHRGRVLVGHTGHVDALQRRVLRGWIQLRRVQEVRRPVRRRRRPRR